MTTLKIYQVDAFTDKLFSGNPAGVCFLKNWISDDLMQAIANENNIAETAFLVSKGDDFEIRWFTPAVEVDLCGHATLASGFVLFNHLNHKGHEIKFYSPRSGLLKVLKQDDMYFLDFPTDTLNLLSNIPQEIILGTGIKPIEVYKGKTDFIAVVETEQTLENIQPNVSEIARLDGRGLIVTSKSNSVDFVSRFFAPQSGINEDPVTGSAHTSLTPLWAEKLGKKKMVAKQLSKRGGTIQCEYLGERCLIGGNARLYLVGDIFIQ